MEVKEAISMVADTQNLPAVFVPDPALDALYKQAVASARQFGWEVPSREEFEDKCKAEIASKRNE